MFGRSRSERIKDSAVNASELALQLAQDKKFRKRLLSAIAHTAEARRRTRRSLGFGGALARLAADQALLRELRDAGHDLEQAHGRLERKRRGHKLRKVIVLALLGLLASIPRLRERFVAAIRAAMGRTPDSVSGTSASSGDAAPARLEDLSKEELYARAQELDIPGRSEMSKEQLVEALRAKS
jgi:hypothetical protein